MRDIVVDGNALTVDDVVAVAHGQARATLGPDVPGKMETSRAVVVNALRGDAPLYGVNTGFGALADTPAGEADLATLQGAIVRSHAAAVGVPLDDEAVRAILLLRARTLAAGYSGVRADLPARLLELLARGLLPVIPGKGSVGASGDLAHLAQPLIGEGRLRSAGDPPEGRPAAEVLAEHGLEPLTLAPKEGLSLVNGTEPMQALLAFSVHDADMLVQAADIACALSVNLRALLAGSPLLASHRDSRHAVQDAYCLRCAPQVHGAVRDVLSYVRQVITIELGAIVDNPVIVPDGEVMTTGNFHGEPLAFAADMLAIALSELASISERRVDRMLDPAFSRGLPRSWRPRPASIPASCSPSTPRPHWSARTRCSPTRPAWTPSRHRASRKITCRWAGPRCASCVKSSATSGRAWPSRSAARRKGSTCASPWLSPACRCAACTI
jgi:histidine ammonia-lyase